MALPLCSLGLVIALVLVGAVAMGQMTVALALDLGLGLCFLAWLFVLVKFPWDLYFAARWGRIEAQTSLRTGIHVADEDLATLALMERRLLVGAIGAHVVTAGAIVAMAWVYPATVHLEFAWLFLASGWFRPVWEGYAYLRTRLSELHSRVRYPREDVMQLKARVDHLASDLADTRKQLETFREDQSTRNQRLGQDLKRLDQTNIEEHSRLDTRLVKLTQSFEDALDRLNSEQDLMVGVRAFVRMFKESSANGTQA